jgi:hypothetical protein
MNGIIDSIQIGCDCTAVEAQEYLDSELANLRELAELDDLRIDDFDTACSNLGIDLDYVEDLLYMM